MTNPEDTVIDDIDQLVDWQLSRGESWGSPTTPTCPPWTYRDMYGDFGE